MFCPCLAGDAYVWSVRQSRKQRTLWAALCIADARGRLNVAEESEPLTRVRMQDKPGWVMFDHGDPALPRVDAAAALNTLTFSPPAPAKRRVQSELWCGAKANDLLVTMNIPVSSGTAAAKGTQWAAEDAASGGAYGTQTRDVAMQAALGAAAVRASGNAPHAAASQRDAAAPAQVAPGGASSAEMYDILGCGDASVQNTAGVSTTEFSEEAAKPYRTMYYRHPIPYTVRVGTEAEHEGVRSTGAPERTAQAVQECA